MGSVLFRSSKDLRKKGLNSNKANIKVIKSKKNTKLNIIFLLQILNLIITSALGLKILGII